MFDVTNNYILFVDMCAFLELWRNYYTGKILGL